MWAVKTSHEEVYFGFVSRYR